MLICALKASYWLSAILMHYYICIYAFDIQRIQSIHVCSVSMSICLVCLCADGQHFYFTSWKLQPQQTLHHENKRESCSRQTENRNECHALNGKHLYELCVFVFLTFFPSALCLSRRFCTRVP